MGRWKYLLVFVNSIGLYLKIQGLIIIAKIVFLNICLDTNWEVSTILL